MTEKKKDDDEGQKEAPAVKQVLVRTKSARHTFIVGKLTITSTGVLVTEHKAAELKTAAAIAHVRLIIGKGE